MSFVSVFAMPDFITVMSDGLVSDEETGKELEKGYQKFHLIGPKQFMAYTGLRARADMFKKIVPFKKEGYNLLPLMEELKEGIDANVSPESEKISIVVGGIENEEVIFYTFNNIVGQLIPYSPGSDGMSYAFLESSHITTENHQYLDIEFRKFMVGNGFNTPNKALKGQEFLNSLVEKIDPTVNKKTFGHPIRK